jgi:hypothetical protein
MNYRTQWLDNGPWMEGFFFIFIFIFHIFTLIEKRKSGVCILVRQNKTKENHFLKKIIQRLQNHLDCIFEHYIKL